MGVGRGEGRLWAREGSGGGGAESVERGKLIDTVWLPSATVSLSCFGGGGFFGSGFSSARLAAGLSANNTS